jgi:CheY-like chemotaxis protein
VAESAQNRRLLTAMRAAAILIIATGLNDVIAGAVPRYEPLYLFLAAIALVVALDGVILGAITAVGAIAFYALLFMTRPAALSLELLLPLGEAFATVLVAGIARGIVRARRRAAPPEVIPRPIQTFLPPPSIAADNSEVLTAIDELRIELRNAVGDLAFSRDREALLERTAGEAREALLTRVRLAEEETARLVRLADTERTERDHLEAAARSFEATTREREALARDEREAGARTMAAARAEAEANALALASAREESETSARALKATRNAAEANARALAKARDEADANARALADARKELDASRAENDALRGELGRLRGAVEVSHAELVSQGRDLTALNAAAEELRRTIEIERTRGDEERTLRMTASERIEELERAMAELERAMAEQERLIEGERASRNSEGSSSRERVAQAEQTLADERALRERLEVDAATRDTEARTLRARIEELDQALGELSGTHGDVESGMRAKIETLEEQLREAAAEREAHRTETAALRAQIEELEQSLASAGTDFDQKLNTIVAHLAEDHEADLGKAMEDKEEARAEVRSLTLRLSTLQKRVEEEQQTVMARVRETEERHRRSVDDATRQLAETRQAAQREIDRLRARVAEIEAVRSQQAPRADGKTRPRVLIAHPDADLRMSARASLERAGYEILSAGDGLEALRTANAERPDVVIADAVMPKMDGRELCQLLKSQEKTAHIRVILLTRSTDEPHKGDLPPDGILRKPVPLEMLKSTLAALLGGPAPNSERSEESR